MNRILYSLLRWLPAAALGLTLNAEAQTTDYGLTLTREISDSIADFEVDNLGNLYLVRGQRQQLKKLSPRGDSMALFNEVRRYGRLHSIDVSNPLKVLLFYREFSTIVILDRFLHFKAVVDLRPQGLVQVSAITQSYDNQIWLYDELDARIRKIDETGKPLLESPDFRVVFDDPPVPVRLEDYNRFLYAYDPAVGLLVMDYFGAYRNKIPFTGWRNLHGMSRGIVATDSSGLVYYRPGTIELQQQPLPRGVLAARKIRLHNRQLYALMEDGRLMIYQLPES